MRKERAVRTRQNSERGGMQKVDSDAGKEFAFTIENIVKDVSLSQRGCEGHEDGLEMIDSGASVNVCPKWFGESEKSDGSDRLRGADGKRPIWLRNRKPPETI